MARLGPGEMGIGGALIFGLPRKPAGFVADPGRLVRKNVDP
jgi:hypothetical protein